MANSKFGYPFACLPLPPGFRRTVATLQPDHDWHLANFVAPYPGLVAAHGRDELLAASETFCAGLDDRDPKHYWARKIGPRQLEVLAAPDMLDPAVAQVVPATTCIDGGFFLIFVGGEVATQGLSRFNALVMAADVLACRDWPQETSTWARWKSRDQIEILRLAPVALATASPA